MSGDKVKFIFVAYFVGMDTNLFIKKRKAIKLNKNTVKTYSLRTSISNCHSNVLELPCLEKQTIISFKYKTCDQYNEDKVINWT